MQLMNLSILFNKRLDGWSMKSQKIIKNVADCFLKPRITSSNLLFLLSTAQSYSFLSQRGKEYRKFTFQKLDLNHFYIYIPKFVSNEL